MEDFANTIIFWGAVVAAGTGIIVGIVKLLKFLKTVSDKMEILNQIEIHEESRQSIIAGHQEMKDTLTDLSKNVKSLAAGISDLNKRFDDHMKTDTDNMKKDISKTLRLTEELRTASDKQRELLVQETRDHLLTKMEAALESGEISSITELQRVGDLFDAYSDNGGNHGVGDVYEKYRKLPLKGGDK